MAERFTLAEIQARTYEDRDARRTVWLVDPVGARRTASHVLAGR